MVYSLVSFKKRAGCTAVAAICCQDTSRHDYRYTREGIVE
jgi:hypothetical protein